MQSSTLKSFLDHLRQLTDPARARELSDADLLERFRSRREEAAFTLLVQRHGPMVQGVCRRVLGDHHDAEDAFQATFLVLVRNAAAVRKQQSLASFLYGVASRIAHKARTRSACRRRHERAIRTHSAPVDPLDPLTADELRVVLDDEIARLPDKYRMPFILCYLTEKTHEQAAGELGWPKSSVTARLARARQLLQQRLTRRGFTVPAGMLAVLLTEQSANAALAAGLTLSTVRLAVQALMGETLAATTAAVLADGFVKGAAAAKYTVMLTLLATMGFAAALGTWMASSPVPSEQPKARPPQAVDDRGEKQAQTRKPRVDLYGDPLPRGALVRIGTVRLRHGDFVKCVCFSQDGKTVVSGSVDGTLRSWEVATGKEIHCFRGHKSVVMSLSISKDGKTLASISQDFTIRIWDLVSGKELRKLDAPRGAYYDLCFSPDGQTLASCGHHIRIWETKTYRVIREFEQVQKWIPCLAFSPDGKTLVAGDEKGMIGFWDTTSWEELRRVRAHTNKVHSLAFSPDGKFLASAGEDGLLSLRKPTTGEEIRPLFKGEPRGCSRLAFSPDSKTLAWSWGADRNIHLFETSTGKEIRQLKGTKSITNTVAFSPDGRMLASGEWDSTVRLWDVQTGKELLASHEPQGPVASLVFCANDKLLAGAPWGSMIYCWDAVTGKTLHRLAGHTERLHFVAASLDGQTLFSADLDGFVRRWDLAKAKELRCLRVNEDCAPVAVSPDGKMLATQDFRQQTGTVYDLATGKELCRFGPASDIIFLPDGKSLMLHDPDQGLIRWDIASGKIVARFPGDTRQNTCLAVSPDGKIFASGTANNRVHRWDLRSGEALSSLDGQQKSIASVAFSPDGRTLASGGKDGTIWLWEMLTGRQRVVLRGHKGPVSSLTFSRDGRRLASGSKDTTALVWDLTGGIGTAPPKELTAAPLNDLWRDLAAEDAAKAYRSIWLLASAPKQSLPFLQARLRPIPAPDAKRISQLLADLDSEEFKIRTKARDELAKLGETAETALREVAEKPPSLEVARQVKDLLEKLKNERKTPSAERLRVLRAVEVLERIATRDAKQLLDDLAKGAADARLTREAADARSRTRK